MVLTDNEIMDITTWRRRFRNKPFNKDDFQVRDVLDYFDNWDWYGITEHSSDMEISNLIQAKYPYWSNFYCLTKKAYIKQVRLFIVWIREFLKKDD